MKFTFKVTRSEFTGYTVTVRGDGEVLFVRNGTRADTRQELLAEARKDAEAYG